MTKRRIPRRAARAVRRFTEIEASGGVVLVATALIALAWANSGFAGSYDLFWELRPGPSFGEVDLDLRHWVNEGLMTLFFFVVGLEIKRELVDGELSDPRAAALPVIAALGGMVVPALIYVAINQGGPGLPGWGIPVATDIAFVVGTLALLGDRAPRGLRAFLLTLAIADDVAAIIVIALFYAGDIRLVWLSIALVLCLGIVLLRRLRVSSLAVYVIVGLLIWWATLQSGVHATLAGVALGLLTPTRDLGDSPRARAPAERLQEALHPWTSFLVVPLFALANAGVRLDGGVIGEALRSPVTLGVVLGLVVGKTVGIASFSWLAVKARAGVLPNGVDPVQLVGGAALGGIGFTVSLFIADIAFGGSLLSEAKIGVLLGSVMAALVGGAILFPREGVPEADG